MYGILVLCSSSVLGVGGGCVNFISRVTVVCACVLHNNTLTKYGMVSQAAHRATVLRQT